jgi:hypothetical protein
MTAPEPLCDPYTEAANVVSVMAAESTLEVANIHIDVACQLPQWVEQLRSHTRRSCWVLVAVGNTPVDSAHQLYVCAWHLRVLESVMSYLP